MLRTIFTTAATIVATLCVTAASVDTKSTASDTIADYMTADEAKIDRLQHENKLMYIGDDSQRASLDSMHYLITRFYVDQFRNFQDPLAPYFMVLSRDGRLALGIGGSVRMRGWYDFDGSMPVNGFVPYMIPVPRDPAQSRRIGGTPGGTAIFLRVIGRNPVLGDITGYIQCDFSGPNGTTFILKKAYAEINNWTIGYASTTFSDPQADAPTIDGAGQNGRISRSAMLVRWLRNVHKNWQIAASVELPKTNIESDGITTRRVDDWLPDFAVFGQYQWGHNQHIRLSGTLRTLAYRDLTAAVNRSVVGWGVQLSAIVWPLPSMAVYATANTGRGYESYVGDLAIGAYDLVNDPDKTGRMYAPQSVGTNIGVRYNFNTHIYACTALGAAYYTPRHDAPATEYKRGNYAAINLFWEPTSRLQLGIEYLLGRRTNMDGMRGHANRVDALFQFAF